MKHRFKANLIKNQYSFLTFLLFLGWALVLLRLWNGGFTGGDEGFTASAAVRFGGIFSATKNMAEGHGRFYHYIFYPLAQLPYLIGDLAWTNSLRIFSSAVPIFSFYLFTRTVFGLRIAILSGFLLLALQDTVGNGYNPFHSLPFWFNLGIGLLFFSLYFYVRALRSNKSTALAYFVFFISLCSYESMLFYSLAFPLLWLWFNRTDDSNNCNLSTRFRYFLSKNSGLFLTTGLYLSLYLSYRFFHQSQYVGANDLVWRGVSEFSVTVFKFSVNGIYLGGNNSFFGHYVFEVIFLLALIAIGIVTALLNPRTSELKPLPLKSLLYFSIGFFVFTPNLLYGLTARYIDWAKRDPYYLGSYFSSFAIALIFSLILEHISCYQYIKNRSIKILSILALLLITTTLLIMAHRNHLHSYKFFNQSKADSINWRGVRSFIDGRNHNNIPSLSEKLCTKTILKTPDPYDYWSLYLSESTKSNISLKYDDGNQDCQGWLDIENNLIKLLNSKGSIVWAQQIDSTS